MTVDEFYDWTMRAVARARKQEYDPTDMTLRRRITIAEAAAILGRRKQTIYGYVSQGFMRRSNDRRCYNAEFEASEIVRCAMLTHLIRDPHIPAPAAATTAATTGRVHAR